MHIFWKGNNQHNENDNNTDNENNKDIQNDTGRPRGQKWRSL